ncbi:MAG: hypothetical protein ACRCX2_06440 [Paraclostridium sp.]
MVEWIKSLFGIGEEIEPTYCCECKHLVKDRVSTCGKHGFYVYDPGFSKCKDWKYKYNWQLSRKEKCGFVNEKDKYTR